MRYNEFRDQLQNALQDVGLFGRRIGDPTESIDLSSTLRRWKVYVLGLSSPDAEPFHVSAKLAFGWAPFDAARSYTCEEDLLTELLGRRKQTSKTVQRFIRVDLKLHAALPYGSTAPIPEAQTFAAWTLSIRQKLQNILTQHKERQGRLIAILGGLGEVEIETRCDTKGSLSLAGISVAGFRMVRVPRVWDDPDRREREKDAGAELYQLAERFKQSLTDWTACVAELARWICYAPPPPEAKPVEPWYDDLPEDDDSGGPDTIH
jgi:hypothetical protein